MPAQCDFRVRFTTKRIIAAASFENALFFECAPLHVLLVTLFLDNGRIALLAADRALISQVSTAHYLEEVDVAIEEYLWRLARDVWWRRKARFRISTRKLRRIAERCLPVRATPR